MTTAIDAAIETAQQLVSADGTKLEVLEQTPDRVSFRLDLEGASCADCVLPVAHLTSVIGDTMRRVSGNPALLVEIDDPRATP
ncbi:hypothetical protein ACWEOW_22100 [Monashia sp. NPDC004114]